MYGSTRPKKIKTTQEEMLSMACEYLKKDGDCYDHLAKSWACKLRNLTQSQRLLAEKGVNDIIFEAEMGTLTRDSIKINESSVPSHNANYKRQMSFSVPSPTPSLVSVASQSPSLISVATPSPSLVSVPSPSPSLVSVPSPSPSLVPTSSISSLALSKPKVVYLTSSKPINLPAQDEVEFLESQPDISSLKNFLQTFQFE